MSSHNCQRKRECEATKVHAEPITLWPIAYQLGTVNVLQPRNTFTTIAPKADPLFDKKGSFQRKKTTPIYFLRWLYTNDNITANNSPKSYTLEL